MLNTFFNKIKKILFYVRRDIRKPFAIIPPRKKEDGYGHKVPISAYLSIYEDADVLEYALKMIRPYVDELIVVDGAYSWMADYLSKIGLDPNRSREHVYEILNGSGIRLKIISRVWKNEIEKRQVGYQACTHRYRMRIDSDEIIQIYSNEFDAFFRSGCAVAEMYMPTQVTNRHVVKGGKFIDLFRRYPRQCFLFDSDKIGPEDHLKYLWLVLPADMLPEGSKKEIYAVYEHPIAFNYHLTSFRHVETSARRGSFYLMNWMRKNGAPWLGSENIAPEMLFNKFFEEVPPATFYEVMKSSSFVYGEFKLRPGERLATVNADNGIDFILTQLYEKYIENISKRTIQILEIGGVLLLGFDLYFDFATLANIRGFNSVEVQFATDVSNIVFSAYIYTLSNTDGCVTELPIIVENGSIRIRVSSDSDNSSNSHRRVVQLKSTKSPQKPYWTKFILKLHSD